MKHLMPDFQNFSYLWRLKKVRREDKNMMHILNLTDLKFIRFPVWHYIEIVLDYLWWTKIQGKGSWCYCQLYRNETEIQPYRGWSFCLEANPLRIVVGCPHFYQSASKGSCFFVSLSAQYFRSGSFCWIHLESR